MSTDNLRPLIIDTAHRLIGASVSDTMRKSASQGEWPQDLWTALEENGFTAIQPDGLSYGDGMALMRTAGYWAIPIPWAESVMATKLALDAGIERPDGVVSLAARSEPGASFRQEGDRLLISGTWHNVPWARRADSLVVVLPVPGGDGVLAVVERNQFSTEMAVNMASEPSDTVRMQDAASSDFSFVPYNESRVMALGALSRVMAAVGALERGLEMSVQHASARVQFGRAIAKFQAIQALLAEMAAETAAMRAIAFRGQEAVDAGREDDIVRIVALAKTQLAQAVRVVTTHAHQVHGAMGVTEEYSLQAFTRRLWCYRHDYGNERYWSRVLADQLAGRDLWNFIVGA